MLAVAANKKLSAQREYDALLKSKEEVLSSFLHVLADADQSCCSLLDINTKKQANGEIYLSLQNLVEVHKC